MLHVSHTVLLSLLAWYFCKQVTSSDLSSTFWGPSIEKAAEKLRGEVEKLHGGKPFPVLQ